MNIAFLNVPGRTLCFPVYNVETFWTKWMSCGTVVLVNWRCSLILFPSALPDSPMYASGQLMWGHLKW